MTGIYECKVECIGTGKNDGKQLRVLGRVISIEDTGVSYEPDQRHVEAMRCASTWASTPVTHALPVGRSKSVPKEKQPGIVPSESEMRQS